MILTDINNVTRVLNTNVEQISINMLIVEIKSVSINSSLLDIWLSTPVKHCITNLVDTLFSTFVNFI